MKKISILFAILFTVLALFYAYITSAGALGEGLNTMKDYSDFSSDNSSADDESNANSSSSGLGDALSALGEYFGLTGGSYTGDNADANSDTASNWGNATVNVDSEIVDILQGILGSSFNTLTNSQITEILNNFDINTLLGGDSDIINEVLELIGSNQPSTGDRTEERGSDVGASEPTLSTQPSTLPQYTNIYVTEAPAVTYSYSPATTIPYVTQLPAVTQIYTTSAPTRKYGDVDRNGKIEAADARLALRASVGLKEPGDVAKDSAAYLACDVDGDGKVTSADARLILRASVGLEDASKFGKKA